MNKTRCELILPDNLQESFSERMIYQSISDYDQDLSVANISKIQTQQRSRTQTAEIKGISQWLQPKQLIANSVQEESQQDIPSNQTINNDKIHVKQNVLWLDQVSQQVASPSITHHQVNPRPFRQLIQQFLLVKFVKKMLLLIRPNATFTRQHFDLINDQASEFIVNPTQVRNTITSKLNNQEIDCRIRMRIKFRSIVSQIQEIGLSMILAIPLIEPNSKGKFIWNIITCLLRLYLIVWIPILMSFPVNQSGQHYLILALVAYLLIIDIVVRCFTIQFEQGLPVKDRYILGKNQLNLQTIIELAGNIILLLLAHNFYNSLFQNIYTSGWPKVFLLLLYPQISIIFELLQSTQESLNLSKYSASLIELFKLVSLILLIQHMFSCLWGTLGQYCRSIGLPNWMELTAGNADWNSMYLESLYFISVTMFTVGYGDINPQNVYEKIFCIVFMFLCTLQLSYSVNTIGSILAQIRQQSENIRQKITAVNQYMQNKKISQPLQVQVRKYFKFYFQQLQVQQTFEQDEMMKLLPEEIRQSLVIESARALLEKCDLFQGLLSEDFLNQLLGQIYFYTFQPGVVISSKTLNLDNEQFICIIEQGLVEVYREKQLISTLKQHQSIGLWEFLHQTKSEFTFKSAGFTSVLVIPFNAFQEIMKDRQLDKEHYFNMIDDLQIGQQCLICANNKHQTQQCKLVQYVPDYEKIIKRYLFHQDQGRKKIRRNRNRTKDFFHSLNDNELIEEAADVYQLDNENDISKMFPNVEEEDGQMNTQPRQYTNDENDSVIEQPPIQKQIAQSTMDKLIIHSTRNSLEGQKQMENHFRFDKHPQIIINNKFTPRSQDMKGLPRKRTSYKIHNQFQLIHCESNSRNSEQFSQLYILQCLQKQSSRYNKKEQDQLFEVIKTIENHYYDPLLVIENSSFESLKEYSIYHPDWNINNVVRQLQFNKLTTNINNEIDKMAASTDSNNKYNFNKYMLYPNLYYQMCQNKNKLSDTQQDSQLIERRKQTMLKSDQYHTQKQKRQLRRSKSKVFPDK